jgi:hypothetical protein
MIKTNFFRTAFLATVTNLPAGEYRLKHGSKLIAISKKGGIK